MKRNAIVFYSGMALILLSVVAGAYFLAEYLIRGEIALSILLAAVTAYTLLLARYAWRARNSTAPPAEQPLVLRALGGMILGGVIVMLIAT